MGEDMKSARGFVMAVIITTALILGTSGSALASGGRISGPDAHASCVGILSWANTHHVPNFPTRAEISHLVKSFGLPPGAFFSYVAGFHEGSIFDCNLIVPPPPR